MPCLVSHKGREGRKGEARRLLVDPAAMAQGRSHGLIQSPSALAKTRHKPRSNARQMVGFDHVENFPGAGVWKDPDCRRRPMALPGTSCFIPCRIAGWPRGGKHGHPDAMSHGIHDAVGLELARQVAARLRQSSQPLVMARENLERWRRLNRGSATLIRCYDEWAAILEKPADEVCNILCAAEEGLRLRQNSPFAGVLSAEAVWSTKRRLRLGHATPST